MLKKVYSCLTGVFFVLLIFLTNAQVALAGVVYDMADDNSYNFRLDGSLASGYLGWGHIQVADLNNNDRSDLIVSAANTDYNGTASGSVYIILDDVLATFSDIKQQIDLSDTNNYSLRIDGAEANHWLGLRSVETADLDNDGKTDLILGAPGANYNNRTGSGSLYVIYNHTLNTFLGSISTTNLSDDSRFDFRADGASNGYLANGNIVIIDIDRDGFLDLMVGEGMADANNRTDSGSVYIVKHSLYSTWAGVTKDLANIDNYNYRFDGAVARDRTSNFSLAAGDLDNDDKPDLVLSTHTSDSQGRTNNSYLFIVYNTLLNTFSEKNIDLADDENWSIRIDGDSDNASFSHEVLKVADINGDGLNDLIAGAPGRDGQKGALYIFFNNLISQYTGPSQIIDTYDPSTFSIRFDGVYGALTEGKVALADFDYDGYIDILIPEDYTDFNDRTNSGSAYLIYGSLIKSYTTPGQTLSLADTDNFSVRYDGEADNLLFSADDMEMADVNNDGRVDLIIGAFSGDNNNRSASGSVYVLYNYPHTISVTSGTYSYQSTPVITGTITATNSITNISGVEWSNTNTFMGTWNSCNADDGAFDSKTESFYCTISPIPQTGTSTIYVRSYDSNTSYTAPASYGISSVSMLGLTEASPGNEISPCSFNALFAPTIYSAIPLSNTITSAVSLTYSSPGEVSHYEIAYGVNNQFQWSTVAQKVQTDVTIGFLSLFKTYQFKVRGVTSCGVKGPWSTPRSVLGASVNSDNATVTTPISLEDIIREPVSIPPKDSPTTTPISSNKTESMFVQQKVKTGLFAITAIFIFYLIFALRGKKKLVR